MGSGEDVAGFAEGAPGKWSAIDGERHWQLFRDDTGGAGHPMQVVKAPKESDIFEPYWPTPAEADYILAALNAVPSLLAERAEADASFGLRWRADMRAIAMWQEATGRTLVWPDHADLCVWLLGCIDDMAAGRSTVVAGETPGLPDIPHFRRFQGDYGFPVAGLSDDDACELSVMVHDDPGGNLTDEMTEMVIGALDALPGLVRERDAMRAVLSWRSTGDGDYLGSVAIPDESGVNEAIPMPKAKTAAQETDASLLRVEAEVLRALGRVRSLDRFQISGMTGIAPSAIAKALDALVAEAKVIANGTGIVRYRTRQGPPDGPPETQQGDTDDAAKI